MSRHAPDLGHIPIGEGTYRGDLELVDRYVAFSAELVRMALLAFGALGFYLKEFVANAAQPDRPPLWFVKLFAVSAVVLAVTIAAGLLHRYYSSDGLHHHFKSVRLGVLLNDREDTDLLDSIEYERISRNRRYSLANRWLVTAECGLVAAGGVIAATLAIRLAVESKYAEFSAYLAAALIIGGCTLAALRGWIQFLNRGDRPRLGADRPRRR